VVFAKKPVQLVGGGQTYIYINQRNLRSFPPQKAIILAAYLQLLKSLPRPDLLSDVPSGTIPIVSSLSDKTKIPQITPRDKIKDHGLGEMIIGSFKKGQNVLIVEDTVTLATSIIKVAQILRAEKLKVTQALGLVLRDPQGFKNLAQIGIRLTYLLTLPELINLGADLGYINKNQLKLAQSELAQLGPFS